MGYNVYHADVTQWARDYKGPKFHAMITDTPYHLTSITKRFGKAGSKPAKYGKDGAFKRVSKGFMQSEWDGVDENGMGVAFKPETWAALAEHLYPGAFGMAFASSRGWHRMAVAIEDAGLIIHPTIFRVTTKDGSTIFCYAEDIAALYAAGYLDADAPVQVRDVIGMIGWAYGSGFPKATNIASRIDKRAGATPNVVGKKKQAGAKFKQTQALIDNGGFNDPDRAEYDLTEPATELAQAWKGHRYGGQVLKPAIEPIIVFQKPYDRDAITSMIATGAGALNVDGARIGNDEVKTNGGRKFTNIVYGDRGVIAESDTRTGRWSANLVLEHTVQCTEWQCVDGCPVRLMDEQSGESISRANTVSDNRKTAFYRAGDGVVGGVAGEHNPLNSYSDTGTAARFFFNADWHLDQLEQADAMLYVPKASTAERDAGLENAVLENRERLEIVLTRSHIEGESEWEFEGRKVVLSVDTERSQPKVTGVFTIGNNSEIEWNTLLFGNDTMAPSIADSKFTMLTETNLTTPLKTLNWLAQSYTNEFTVVANSETANGSSLVESAETPMPYLIFTNEKMVLVPGVGNVASGTRWKISASEKLFAPLTVGDGRNKSIDNAFQRGETARYNPHATVKPISLIKYLATLLLPPAMYAPNRRMLVPFSGVNSEVIGALLAGWDEVVGVELEKKHVEYAIPRTDWWVEASRVAMTTDPKQILSQVDEATPLEEIKNTFTLFDLLEAV